MPRPAKLSAPSTQPVSDLAPSAIFRQEFARKLSQHLLVKGLSQADLAKKTKMDRSTISLYVRGKMKPTGTNLRVLAEALGVPPADLMPEATESAYRSEIPSIDLKVSAGHPNRAWLQINRELPFDIAAQIIHMINEAETSK